jgi:putative ABC transport system permease protein
MSRGNFFSTLVVQPWVSRLMTDADDQEGAPPVAVKSYHIWRDKYGSDPSVVGTGYQINGHPFTVIGVAAPGFYGAKLAGNGMPDFWLPLTSELLIDGATSRLKRPNGNFLDLLGRVRPGTNPKTLEAKLKVDPVMLMLATVLLGLAALLATVFPARRAASVEPMVALRSE